MSINWRKPVVYAMLHMVGSETPGILKQIRANEFLSAKKHQDLQNEHLTKLLLHAWQNTDYYHEILEQAGVVRAGKVHLDQFPAIPFLTKSIFRDPRQMKRLLAQHPGRGRYLNHTGGSTGEPISFWQDAHYQATNVANIIYFFSVNGKQVGEPEFKIWGSERDLFEGTIGFANKLKFFLYNRTFENCFRLSEPKINEIVDHIERIRPKIIWGYVDGLYVIARSLNQRGQKIRHPVPVICAAGTLHPHMRTEIEQAFGDKALNAYGSREMGGMAFECRHQAGLHIFSHSHYIESVNPAGHCLMEECGELVVTSLTNYTMPLIRYRIGDLGTLTQETCPCGRGFPMLKSVSGRIMESFINRRGEYIQPEYFIHLVGVVYNTGFVRQFQVIQRAVDLIEICMVLNAEGSEAQIETQLQEVAEKIKLVMGRDCQVQYKYVTSIPSLPSGKYVYTRSDLQASTPASDMGV